MAKPKRVNVNAFLSSLGQENVMPEFPVAKHSVPEEQKNPPPTVHTEPRGAVKKDSRHQNEQIAVRPKRQTRIKQVNMSIGEEREFKLDDLAYQYSRRKKYRVNRNDVVRYLIDKITLEELLGVDLSQYEK
jgi:hypothetical protein